ncbi:MAG TPA: molybdopterin-dependent oxidoreductase [Pseudonocardiaceae bacterium]
MGLGVGHLAAGLVSPAASPFVAVGGAAIDRTPSWLKDFAVRSFGTYDKVVLLLGMAVVICGFAVAAGLLSRRSRTPGLVLLAALGVVAGAAVLSRPAADPLAWLPPLAALLAGLWVFVNLHRLGRTGGRSGPGEAPAADPSGPAASGVARRGFLVSSAAVAVGAGLTGAGGQALAGGGDVDTSRRAAGRIVAGARAPAIPAGADFAADGSPSFITPNRDFYRIDTNLIVPRLRAEDWRLRIHGMVDRELTLDWAALTSRPLVVRTVTMTCVSNEIGGSYISNANFTGVPLSDILAEAGVRHGADQLVTTSVDGWTCGTPTAGVLDPARQAMLVIGMNSEPLPIEHGFPVRMLVPGLYGYVSGTKWLVDMEFTTFEAKQAYWIERGWAQQAPIKTMSRIDRPGGFGEISPDSPLTGIAWAQTRGIEKVEVRIDHGAWRVAELSTEVSPDTWRMWRLPGRLPPGPHVAQVRATDGTGYTQTEDRAAPIPDGATGWHTVQFTVR